MKIVIVKSVLALLVLLVALLLFVTVDTRPDTISRGWNIFNLSLGHFPTLAQKAREKPGMITLQLTYDKKLLSTINLYGLDEEKHGLPTRAEINFDLPGKASLLELANDPEDFGTKKISVLTHEQYSALLSDTLRITVYTSFYPEGWLLASTK